MALWATLHKKSSADYAEEIATKRHKTRKSKFSMGPDVVWFFASLFVLSVPFCGWRFESVKSA
jgi:hypothetical protein